MTRQPLIASSDSRREGGPHTLTFGQVLSLGGSSDLALTVAFTYEIYNTGQSGNMKYRVRTLAYKHQVVTTELDEVVLFHWHPAEAERTDIPSRPHIHLSRALLADAALLTRRAHLPSGRVSLEDVVEFVITDLDVSPLRDDWADVIESTRRLFEQYRTWGGRGLPDTEI